MNSSVKLIGDEFHVNILFCVSSQFARAVLNLTFISQNYFEHFVYLRN